MSPAAEGVRLAEAADHPYSRVLAYWAVGWRALRQGDSPQAISVLERALDLAQGARLWLVVPQVTAEAQCLARPTAVHWGILSWGNHWLPHAGLQIPAFEIPQKVLDIYPVQRR